MERDYLKQRAQEDEQLYRRFAEKLELSHKGEFVAIARDGRLIIEPDQIKAVEKAMLEFGSGNFALRRIGYRALGRWRTRLGH